MSKNSFKNTLLNGALIHNPILVQCVGLCPVIVASSTLKNSVFLGIALCLDLIITCFLASAIMKKIPRFVRVVLYFIIGLLIICPCLWLVETKTQISIDLRMKIYISLLSINSITAVHCEQQSVKLGVSESLTDSLSVSIGAFIVLAVCGAVREILGSGAIGGRSLNLPYTLSGISMPFGCLLILGFITAAVNIVNRRFAAKAVNAAEQSDNEPSEISLDVSQEGSPDEDSEIYVADLDLDFSDEDDEYNYLLSSVNELIDSLSGKNGGDDNQ